MLAPAAGLGSRFATPASCLNQHPFSSSVTLTIFHIYSPLPSPLTVRTATVILTHLLIVAS